MLKSIKFSLIALALSVPAAFAQTGVKSAAPGPINSLNFMATQWWNDNRGGFTFTAANMPAGVAYFIARGNTEWYVNQLLSIAQISYTNSRNIQISYSVVPAGCTASCEAEVVGLGLLP